MPIYETSSDPSHPTSHCCSFCIKPHSNAIQSPPPLFPSIPPLPHPSRHAAFPPYPSQHVRFRRCLCPVCPYAIPISTPSTIQQPPGISE